MPPLVLQLHKKVKEFRDGSYVGAPYTNKSLLNWWLYAHTCWTCLRAATDKQA